MTYESSQPSWSACLINQSERGDSRCLWLASDQSFLYFALSYGALLFFFIAMWDSSLFVWYTVNFPAKWSIAVPWHSPGGFPSDTSRYSDCVSATGLWILDYITACLPLTLMRLKLHGNGEEERTLCKHYKMHSRYSLLEFSGKCNSFLQNASKVDNSRSATLHLWVALFG